MVLALVDRGGQANLNAIDEEFSYALEGALACRLGLLEKRPQLRLARLLRRREVLIQA